jgi:hypothetical protein
MAESPFVLEGDQILREGETRKFSVVWDDFVSISSVGASTHGTEAYINGSSDTGNLLSTDAGSTVFAGNVQTLPLLTVPDGSGGTAIVLEPSMVSGGIIYKTAIVCRILKPGEE